MVMKKIIFCAIALASLLLSPALALFLGVAFALIFGVVFENHLPKVSSKLLKVAVVGLGFGMNLEESLRSSSSGIAFTIFSVAIVMCVGVLLSRYMKISRREGYLISSGTAICGGSAIAAISPVIGAKANETSIALAVVFTLNAIAMLTFPYLGHMLELTQQEFGMWAAIAIHDTSAVVGAAKSYGEEALQIATMVKLSRALWIIPLSLISAALFKSKDSKSRISIPWFIFLFIVAMVVNTYLPLNQTLLDVIAMMSHKLLSMTLFLIGAMLSVGAIKEAGVKPITLGILLWILISVISLVVIINV